MLFCELTLQLEGYGRNPAEKMKNAEEYRRK